MDGARAAVDTSATLATLFNMSAAKVRGGVAGALASRPWLCATGLAAITGSRNALGPKLVARGASRLLRALATVFAALELIGDKMPFAPARTAPIWLATRAAAGAGVAQTLMRRRGRAAARRAAVLGAAVAVASAFVGLRIRLALTKRFGGGPIANAFCGALEDAVLLTAGTRLADAVSAR
jgi:hypothetical protein